MIALPFILLATLAASSIDADEPAPFEPRVDRHGIVELPAERAQLRGERLVLREPGPRISGWSDRRDEVTFLFRLPKSGRFQVVVEYEAGSNSEGAVVELKVGDQARRFPVFPTGEPGQVLPQPLLDPIRLEAGVVTIGLRAVEVPRGQVMELRRVRLVPEGD